ncbi:tripartite tricarboxylate transporter substrate-binding protein [Achromobacter sp. DMS1]|uniref:tripartite tricarboxylate transporter substrate-binding protein n=1 Tax=Achromobacter sp. DMS1 TaxID=1688405 RepID=UPI0009ECA799|nr:tripartite tricarboxylate transporter substrate-binding protein [Achromobacter sp. DMS1]
MIVPYPPGGSTDMLARLVSHKLGERLGQPVIVENKAGAGGNVGTDYAVKQPADGYTIVMGNIGPISINPALYPDLPYQPQRDLAPVTLLMSVPNLLVVNPALPARTVRELIAYAKQSPQPLDYATPGTGTSLHLAGELFAATAGVRLTQVPYRGSAPGLNDTVAGQCRCMFDNMPSALQLVKAGKLRALAITSAARSPEAARRATMAGGGAARLRDLGLVRGAGAGGHAPSPSCNRLDRELRAVREQPDVRRQIADMGGVISAAGPADFRRYIASETDRWGALVRTAHIRLQ